jgi:hypothetical protein
VTDTAATGSAPSPGSKSLPARLIGVLLSPRATYAAIAARPRWLGALAAVAVTTGIAVAVFSSTEVGRTALLDQQITQMQSFGIQVRDAQVQQMEARLRFAPYFGFIGQIVVLPIMALIVAGIAFAVFNAVMGGDATFKQAYAVVAHSGVIVAVQMLFVMPLNYARETMSSPTNLAVFLPFLDENSFAARLLGSIDLFIIWWAVNLAIGLGVLYRKRTAPIATTLLVIYVVIGLIIAAIKTAVSGA